MKTVFDAVNEFKGEFRSITSFALQSLTDNNCAMKGEIKFGSSGFDSNHFSFICNESQYRDIVSQMETNFGKCDPVLAAYYRHVTDKELLTKSTKELEVMDIDWSLAPDDCIGAVESNFVDATYPFGVFVKECDGFDGYQYCHEQEAYPCMEAFTFTSKPQPALTYTQAMADNGELPQIGSKAQFIGDDDYLAEFNISNGDEVECICHTKDFEGESIGVYRHKDGYSVSILTQLIKPLTLPITLIGGKAYQFTHKAGVDGLHGVYHDNKFYIGGDYVESSNCTNIQPLTVEVK